MLRFRLFGVPFEIAPYFWLISAVLGGALAEGPNAILLLVVWVLCVFVSIVVHELGHALAARRFGATPSVSLYGMGGLTSMPGAYLNRGQHILVTLAGPGAGFCLYLLIRVMAPRLILLFGLGDFLDSETPGSIAINAAVMSLIYINLWWTVFNLLPVLPLDGGQVLRDVLGPGRLGAARLIGCLFGVAACAYFALHRSYYAAFIFGYLAFMNFQGAPRPLPGAPGPR